MDLFQVGTSSTKYQVELQLAVGTLGGAELAASTGGVLGEVVVSAGANGKDFSWNTTYQNVMFA